jgi:hypothetical protein
MRRGHALGSLAVVLVVGALAARGQGPGASAPATTDDDILQIQVPVPPRPLGPTEAPPPPTMPRPPAPPARPPGTSDVLPVALPDTAPVGLTNLSRIPRSSSPELLGDGPPLPLIVPLPGGPVVIPRPRGFKIDDNESPVPQDRTFFTMNDFADLYSSVNRRLNTDLRNISVQRETFGVEKAFCNGCWSLEMRLPFNTVSAQSSLPQLAGTRTSLGDLSFLFKMVLWKDDGAPTVLPSDLGAALADLLESTPDLTSRTLVSAGLAVTAPTGPDALFPDPRFRSFHTTLLTPYVGYLWKRGAWYVQGFSSFDIPTDSNDVTLFLNDLSVRYFLYDSASPTQPISAIVPVVEGHLTTPLNHRGLLSRPDPVGTPDLLQATLGVDVRFFDWAIARLGIVTPLTGPNLQNYEVLMQLKTLF